MKRTIYEKLLEWKNRDKRNPLIVDGVRQCGKTWILQQFGHSEFENTAYINLDKSTDAKNYSTTMIHRGFYVYSRF